MSFKGNDCSACESTMAINPAKNSALPMFTESSISLCIARVSSPERARRPFTANSMESGLAPIVAKFSRRYPFSSFVFKRSIGAPMESRLRTEGLNARSSTESIPMRGTVSELMPKRDVENSRFPATPDCASVKGLIRISLIFGFPFSSSDKSSALNRFFRSGGKSPCVCSSLSKNFRKSTYPGTCSTDGHTVFAESDMYVSMTLVFTKLRTVVWKTYGSVARREPAYMANAASTESEMTRSIPGEMKPFKVGSLNV
mmetsp:Transcript_16934/g.41251  ORF Transcript_16934/g.41251 Transcript_16934/m.41251 type:complete len:257 (+) Transcript_16934:4890-5660(+)